MSEYSLWLLFLKRKYNDSCFAPAVRPDAFYLDLIEDIDLNDFIPRVRVKPPLKDF